jgi:hypothetical protein
VAGFWGVPPKKPSRFARSVESDMGVIGNNRATAQKGIARWKGPLGFLGLSFAITGVLVSSAWTFDSQLGAPGYWTWLLTGLQVLALWGAGSKRWWGWLLGAAVQPPWIAYALLTSQLGFIPGCVISAVVQTHSFLRRRAPVRPRRLAPFGLGTTEVAS